MTVDLSEDSAFAKTNTESQNVRQQIDMNCARNEFCAGDTTGFRTTLTTDWLSYCHGGRCIGSSEKTDTIPGDQEWEFPPVHSASLLNDS